VFWLYNRLTQAFFIIYKQADDTYASLFFTPLTAARMGAQGRINMKPKVLLTCSLYETVMDALHQDYEVVHWWELPDQAAYLKESSSGIKAIVTGGHLGASRELIEALPDLEIVASYGVGYDKVDLAACQEAGAAVTNTPDVLTDDVADIVIGLLLCLYRKIHIGDSHVRQGNWPKVDLPLTRSLNGQTLGVVGLGRIGTAVAKRAEALGMKIAWFDLVLCPTNLFSCFAVPYSRC
jgi:lactate dehydrogenase-like 2-hydroxyacid dehydrogenase